MKPITALKNRLIRLYSPDDEPISHRSPLMSAQLLGRLRRELYWTLGETRAHGIFGRVGISIGQWEARHPDESKGAHVFGTATETGRDEAMQEFTFESSDSAEANEHHRFFQETSKQSQCWFLAGFLSGSLSTTMGYSIYVLETQCRAKGDDVCRFIGRPADSWDADHDLLLDIYSEDNMALELAGTRELLKLTKDRYQTLFEHASIPILIIDPDTGAFLDGNIAAEEITGFNRTELLTLNVFDLTNPKDHHHMMAGLKEIVADAGRKEEEMTIIRKDGLPRVVAASSKLMVYGGQHVIQRVLRDITDLKMAEQKEKDLQVQLKRSERLSSIGQLAASVAHEIKNPLGAIRNAIYYIKGALENSSVLATDPQLKEILKLSEEEVDGAVTIIEELLDFSRVIQLVPRKISVNEQLESLSKIITVPPNVRLIMDLDLTLPSTFADPNRLRQVFSNIATNAIQAMPTGGQLTVKSGLRMVSGGDTGSGKELITVTFEDTGMGIEPLHLSKIFEPLFTTKAKGTGLGLTICNNIIEKHGGSIEVSSQLGKGSVFAINIPLKEFAEREDLNHD